MCPRLLLCLVCNLKSLEVKHLSNWIWLKYPPLRRRLNRMAEKYTCNVVRIQDEQNIVLNFTLILTIDDTLQYSLQTVSRLYSWTSNANSAKSSDVAGHSLHLLPPVVTCIAPKEKKNKLQLRLSRWPHCQWIILSCVYFKMVSRLLVYDFRKKVIFPSK